MTPKMCQNIARGGHWGLWFCGFGPFLPLVFQSFRFWSSVLRFSKALQFAVVSL